jgi:hypothetical protein
MVPKVIFKKMSLEENIEDIKWQYWDDNDINNTRRWVLMLFPELKNINPGLTETEINENIEMIVTKFYKEHEKELDDWVAKYNSYWENYNDLYFSSISKYLNTDWDKFTIYGSIGFIAVFPRYLDDYSFSLSPWLKKEELLEKVAHETLHFLWFKKWEELFPNSNRREFDSPYLIWQYSEMVPGVILNSKAIKNDVFGNLINAKSYDSFYNIKTDDGNIIDSLIRIYSENISIDNKIKNGYNFVQNKLTRHL